MKSFILVTALFITTSLLGQSKYLFNENGGMWIRNEGRDVLCYQYGTHYPPPGVDTAFKRSGYFHPVNAPHGQTLTRIDAPDHYHHYGIWNPWTHVEWQGKIYDLWNLKDRKGTVRFEKFNEIKEDRKKSSFSFRHQHVAFVKDGNSTREVLIMNEDQTLIYHHPKKGQNYYFLDLIIELKPATDGAVTLKEYRYGGLGWRCTEEWNKENSSVLTSTGLDKTKADGSLAKWVVVEGALGNEKGGMIWFSHPSNFNHPEPLRIWPDNSNGRGDMFANFSPTKNKDWRLEPGKTYILKYRMLVYNGSMMDKALADRLWNDYSKGNLDQRLK